MTESTPIVDSIYSKYPTRYDFHVGDSLPSQLADLRVLFAGTTKAVEWRLNPGLPGITHKSGVVSGTLNAVFCGAIYAEAVTAAGKLMQVPLFVRVLPAKDERAEASPQPLKIDRFSAENGAVVTHGATLVTVRNSRADWGAASGRLKVSPGQAYRIACRIVSGTAAGRLQITDSKGTATAVAVEGPSILERVFTPTGAELTLRLQVNSNAAGRTASFADLRVTPEPSEFRAAAAGVVVDPAPLVGAQFQQDGPYWPQIIDISEIAPAGTPPLMMLCSSDHGNTLSAKAGLYVWRASDPLGPWVYDRQFYVSQPTTWPAPTGNNLPYAQMEAPTGRVLTDPADGRKKLYIHAHYFAARLGYTEEGRVDRALQVPLLLVSPDGVQTPVPLPVTAVDGRLPEFDAADEPFNEHRGYFTFAPNPFSSLTNPATGRPWAYIANSLYGEGSYKNEMCGRALWGFDSLAGPATLIDRVVNEDAWVSGAPSRPNLQWDMGSYLPHPDGGLWTLFAIGGGTSFAIRAVRTDDAGVATHQAVTVWDQTRWTTAALPAPYTDATVVEARTVFLYRHTTGKHFASLGMRVAKAGLKDCNIAVIVPLEGARPPEMTKLRGALQSHVYEAGDTSLRLEKFAVIPTMLTSQRATVTNGEIVLRPDAQGNWASLAWTTPLPLERYRFVSFQVERFADVSNAASAFTADTWLYATPGTQAHDPGGIGLYAGCDSDDLSDTDADRGRQTLGRVQMFTRADEAATWKAGRILARQLLVGRKTGAARWRYDLGLSLHPGTGSYAQWGTMHSGTSLVGWGGDFTRFVLSDPWTTVFAVRRPDSAVAFACGIRRIRIHAKLHDLSTAGLPQAVRSLTASLRGTSVTLRWKRSLHSGGLPRTGVLVERKASGSGSWISLGILSGEALTTASFSGAKGDSFRVSEVTARGNGIAAAIAVNGPPT